VFAVALGSVETAMLRGIVSEDLLQRAAIPPSRRRLLAEYSCQHDEDAAR